MSDPECADAGEALVEVMRREGTDVAFGIVSIHNQPLVDAVDRHLHFVPVRHEAAAVNAADGYARVSGRLGVAITSTGTGAGNAAGSLIEALSGGGRVLHVTGQIDSTYLGQGRGVIHETDDQLAMLAAVSKRAWSVTDVDDMGRALAEAAVVAGTTPNGPTSVEIPNDLQYRPTSVPGVERPERRPLDDDAIAAAAGALRTARRPLLWCGGGAVAATDEIAVLADLLGAGVITSNSGRGVRSERHASVVGNFAASSPVADLLAESDLLLSIGTHFRSNEVRHYRLALPRPHVQIDVDPDAIGRVHDADVAIVGEAQTALRALIAAMGDHEPFDPAWLPACGAARATARSAMRDDIGPHAVICDAIDEVFPPGSVMARDVTIPSSSWGNRLLPIDEPAANVFAKGGGIGQGLAMGIGASFARPDSPVCVIVGDGGLAVHLGELGTLAQEHRPLVVLLFNDGGYGVLRNLQDAHFDRRAGVDLHTPDFGLVARSFGIDHLRLADVADAKRVLGDAATRRRPVVVEVDCAAIGPMRSPFVPPVPVAST